jgi:PE-PPE domain
MRYSLLDAGSNGRATRPQTGASATQLTARITRSVGVALLTIGCVVMIGLGSTISTISTAPRLLTSALVMGGTLTPTPDQAFLDMAVDDFIDPTVNPDLLPIQGSTVTYPASAGIGAGAPTINESVRIGVANLDAAIAAQQLANPGQPIVVFGYSQSTVVTMIEKANLEQRRAAGETVPDVTFVGIGVGNRPHGGIATYLQGVTIPLVDFTFNGPAPTDPEFGFTTVDIAREYDGLADFPQYPLNLLADLNAVLGVVFVHTNYEQVSLDPNSPKYVEGTTEQQYGDTTYYLIPTPNLPLFDLARLVGVPEALINVVQPIVKVIVDAGYDRTTPFGQPTQFGLFPQIDPVTFTTDLLAAAGVGVANALRLIAPAPAPAVGMATSRPASHVAVRRSITFLTSNVTAGELESAAVGSSREASAPGSSTTAPSRTPQSSVRPLRIRPRGHLTHSERNATEDERKSRTPSAASPKGSAG